MAAARLTLPFRLLLAFYLPFLLLLGLAMAGLLTYLVRILLAYSLAMPVFLPIIILLGLTLIQFVAVARILFVPMPSRDAMELRLPRHQLKGVYDLIADVARQQRLSAPQEIRIAADTIAHVYEDDEGKEILVLGGLAIANFTQEALTGVIAHELAHFAAGDAKLSRRGFKRELMIEFLEARFSGRNRTNLNPLIWLMRLYHLLYRLAWAANSRQQEYAADRYEVAQVGKEAAAATLIYITLPERLPWVRLASIAEACVTTGDSLDKIFAEQRQRVQRLTPTEWKDALRRELAAGASSFDSHPGLKDRLAAIGVSPTKALKLALEQTGPPARELIADWDAIEMELTGRLLAAFRSYHEAKMEWAQIVLGRPVGRG